MRQQPEARMSVAPDAPGRPLTRLFAAICQPHGRAGTTGRGRQIGPVGTTARVAVGGFLLWTVVDPPFPAGISPISIALGLVGFPGLLLGWQAWRASRNPRPLLATGPLATAINFAVVLLLYLTPSYAPPLSATSDAAVIFYGVSMLLAALRGYAGCEVLAISNWLLRRDDHIGCLVFSPVDHLERRWGHQRMGRNTLRRPE